MTSIPQPMELSKHDEFTAKYGKGKKSSLTILYFEIQINSYTKPRNLQSSILNNAKD